jgi:hypothetical protein
MNAKNVHHDKIFKRCFGVLSISDAVILHGVFLKHHKKAFWSFKYISDTAILRGVFFYFSDLRYARLRGTCSIDRDDSSSIK